MDASLQRLTEIEEAQPFSKVCRLTATLYESLATSLDGRQPQNVFSRIGQLSLVATEAGQTLSTLMATKNSTDFSSPIIPKLGWFSKVYEQLDAPTLTASGLSSWLTMNLLGGRSKEYLRRLVELCPDNRLLLTLYVATRADLSADSQLEICQRAVRAEESIKSLDVSLTILAAMSLGMSESSVRTGELSRGDQMHRIVEWVPFFQETARGGVFDPSQEKYLTLIWGLLVKNGFTTIATEIANREATRVDILDDCKQRRLRRNGYRPKRS